MATANVKCVLYARVSLMNDSKSSHLNQMREMRIYAKDHGYQIVGEFQDLGISAYKDKVRPELEAALNMIETGQASVLVVWKMDRLSRSTKEFPKIASRLDDAGASFRSVTEPFLNSENELLNGFMRNMLNMMAQMEVAGIQERMLGFHRMRNVNGAVPIGARPYGYDRPAKNTLVINEGEARVIRTMAQRVIDGDSLRAIARELQAQGIPTAKGDAWSHTTLRTVLLSTTTAGLHKDGTPAESWVGILDRETWEAVGAILNDPARTTHIDGGINARKLKYLLPGLMTCGKCGGRLVTMSHTRGRQYGCESCELSIMAEPADKHIENWIMENVTPEQWASLLTQGKGNQPRVAEQLQGEIDEAWINYYATPAQQRPSFDVFESRIIAPIEQRRVAAETEPAVKIPNVADLHTGWATMTNDERREVIAATVPPITVLPYCKGQTGMKRIAIAA